MRKTVLFLLILFANSSFSQNTGAYDSILVNSLNTRYSALYNELYKIPLDSSHLKFNRFILSLENHLPKDKKKLNEQEKNIKNLRDKATVYFIGRVLIPQNQFDSVQHYHKTLINSEADPYWLGRSESMLAFTKRAERNYIDYVISIKKSLNYYKESKRKSASFRRKQLLLDLIEFYTSENLTPYAKELMPVLQYELDNSLDKKRDKELELQIQLIKIALLNSEGKKKEALTLLNNIELNTSNNSIFGFYERLYMLYFDLGDLEQSFKYFNLFINSPEISKYPSYEKNKNYGLLRFALAKDDMVDAKKHIDYLTKHPFPNQNNRIDLLNYYGTFYNKTKNYKLAQQSYQKIAHLQDSLFKTEFNFLHQLNTYNLVYDKELVRLQSESEYKNKIIEQEKLKNIYIGIIITILLFSIFLVFFYFRKQKQLKTVLELEKTKEILSYKNNFLENVSHEMRTPITIILGYLALIQNKVLDAKKVLKYAEIATKNSEELIKSLNNFLKVSQIEHNAGKQVIVSSKNMNVFFIDIANSFVANAMLKKIKLYYSSNMAQNVTLAYQYEDLQKIIENLISNAIKYSTSNTSIYISCSINKNNILISVKDEGIGITKEDQKQIFSKFYQSTEHSVTGGFGIGLSLVDELVKGLKGNITLSSKPNVGSLFTISLPHHLDNYNLHIKSENEDFSLLTVDANLDEITNNLPKALIVDDNLEMISYYKELLTNSLHCFFVFNGNEALEIIKKEAIDIIISDYRMPIMDGMEFKVALNKENNLKDIPFIMVSAASYDFVNDPKMTLGLNDYIVKPFDKNELLTRIRTLLENKMYTKKLLSSENNEEIVFKNEYSELLNKVNTIIRKNLNNSVFDVKYLASECGYTQRNLNNILQKATGLTLVKTVLEIRLQKAYEFIINNTYSSLSEIMFETGFNSRPYFYKKFENRYGIKPGELKKKYYK